MVLISFDQRGAEMFGVVLEPAIRDAGCDPFRVDQISRTGPIPGQIWDSILSAHVLVADLTNHNPNVLYEIGLAHAAGKPVVLVCREEDVKKASDIESLRHVLYAPMNPQWSADLRPRLTTAIQESLAQPQRARAFPHNALLEYLATTHRPRQPGVFGWLLDEKFVEILFNIHEGNEALARAFEACIGTRQLTEKFNYWGRAETRAWLDLCNDRRYKPYGLSVQFLDSHIDTIVADVRATGAQDIDIVCLGVGSGEKEENILKGVLRARQDQARVDMYAVDSSIDMLAVSMAHFVHAFEEHRNRVRFVGILGDFHELPRVRHIYDRASTNLFVMLGNTLGNYPEGPLLESLRLAMDNGDCVLIDSELTPASEKGYSLEKVERRLRSSYEFDKYLEHAATPLAKCEVAVGKGGKGEDGEVKIRFQPAHIYGGYPASTIVKYWLFARDATVKHNGYSKKFAAGDRLMLGYSVKYTRESLIGVVAEAGLECVQFYEDDDGFYGMGLFRKP